MGAVFRIQDLMDMFGISATMVHHWIDPEWAASNGLPVLVYGKRRHLKGIVFTEEALRDYLAATESAHPEFAAHGRAAIARVLRSRNEAEAARTQK